MARFTAVEASALKQLDNSLLAVYLIVLMDTLTTSLTFAVMPFFVGQMGGSATDLGIVYAVGAAGNIVSNMWMGAASDVCGRRVILLQSVFCSSIGFLLTALAWDLPSLLAARIFLGLTSGSFPVGESTSPVSNTRA